MVNVNVISWGGSFGSCECDFRFAREGNGMVQGDLGKAIVNGGFS